MKKILIFFCWLSIISCENSLIDLEVNDVRDQIIPQFSSMEEVSSTIEMLMNMSQEERVEWEKDHGFKSFHTKCEEVYAMMQSIPFGTQEEVLEKVEE
jgi:hypothetical protein